MPNTIISEGKTTSEAISNGLKKLNVSKEQVDIKILEEHEKRSFFSILAPRVVKVELTVKEDNTQTETPQDEQTQDTTNEHIKDDTPKTGNNDIATIVCSILSVLSAAGIAIVKKF